MSPGVGQHVRDAGGRRVGVDAEQLHLVARGASIYLASSMLLYYEAS